MSRSHILIAFFLAAAAQAQTVWTVRASGASADLGPLVWKGDTLVCMAGNEVLKTTDGIEWTRHAANAPKLKAIAWTDSLLVGVTGTSAPWVSADGFEWTFSDSAAGFTDQYGDIVWTGTHLVATGNGAYTSKDGLAWKTLHYGAEKYNEGVIGWTGAFLVAGGGGGFMRVWNDRDSVLHTGQMRTANWPTQVFWTGKALLCISAGEINLSADTAKTWKLQYYVGPQAMRIVKTASQLVALSSTTQFLSSSDDGLTWAIRNTNAPAGLAHLAWTGKLLVAAGKGGIIATSPDAAPPEPVSLRKPKAAGLRLSRRTRSYRATGARIGDR